MKKSTENFVKMMATNGTVFNTLVTTLMGAENLTSKDAVIALDLIGIEKPEKPSEKPGSVESLYSWFESEIRTEDETKVWIKENMNKTNIGITGFHLRTLRMANRFHRLADIREDETTDLAEKAYNELTS